MVPKAPGPKCNRHTRRNPGRLDHPLANGGKAANPYDVAVDEVRNKIISMRNPRPLDVCIRKLADWIIDTHERFEAVPPIDEDLTASLLADISDGRPKCGTKN